MTNLSATHPTFSEAALATIRAPFAGALGAGRLELSMITPNAVCVSTPEGDRAVIFGAEGVDYHSVSELGDVLAVGALEEVVERSVERFRLL